MPLKMKYGFSILLLVIFLLNIPSSASDAVVARRQGLQPIVLESGDGHVYLLANPATVATSSQSTTSVPSVQGTAVAAAQATRTSGTQPGQNASVPSVQGTAVAAAQATRTSGTQSGQNAASATRGSSSASITTASTLASNLAGTNSSRWPSSITFVSNSNGVPVVGIAFITTVSGASVITNTQPKQSLIIPTGSAMSQVAIAEGNTTTTLKIASLPTASPLPQVSGIQVVSESGTPVIYSPLTLSGYTNTGPVEISTIFVEIINGQTTTQGGWWLIGAGGRIDPPNNRPWKNGGDTVGCIGGPLLCNTPWVDIGGGFGIQFPGSSGIGPPGYPGGPVDGTDENPEDGPPPYEHIEPPAEDFEPPADDSGSDQDPDDDPDKTRTAEQKTQSRNKKTASEWKSTAAASSSEHSTISLFTSAATGITTSRMTTFSGNTTTRPTSSSPASTLGPRAEYFINAAVNASQERISALLKEFDPDTAAKSYMPDIGATPADGGFWIGYNLTLSQAQNISNRSDVLMVATYTDVALSFTTQNPVGVLGATESVTLWTLISNTTSTQTSLLPSATSNLKVRNERHDSSSYFHFRNDATQNVTAELEVNDLMGRNLIQRRDAGTRLVRQGLSPKDLSVLSQKPGVPNVHGVDFVFVETKGDGTWTYLIDTGVNPLHQEFRGNWEGVYGKFNIDSTQIYDETIPWLQNPVRSFGGDYNGHGTCMASKICGSRCGAAKQAMIIPCLVTGSFKSFLVVLDKIILDIPTRWRMQPPQALPGKTTVSISLGWKESEIGGQQGKDDLLAKFKAIINLGATIAVAAGNGNNPSDVDYEGFPSSRYPALLAVTTLPSLIRVGAVDLTGRAADFSQEADVYTVGVDSPCANNSNNLWEIESDGTSGATAEFIGDVDYRMSLPGNPFGFGNDISQYQQKVKDFYTVGYNRRDPSAHPKGAYRRPGQYANVVWNGQDGRHSTICPLLVAPGALKKRGSPNLLADSELESPDICANYTDPSSATSRASTAHTVTITPSSTLTTASVSSSPPLACTQYFYFPENGPNGFGCQCNDGTWNHLDGSEFQDSYSECPSQVAIVSMTAATASATVPPDVSCTKVVFGPSSANYDPFCECSNNLLFPEECPASVSAATTTLTLSEPPSSVTAALTRGDYVTPSPVSAPCVPQCTKMAKPPGPHGELLVPNCYCDPACGGNVHPLPNSENVCPYQVAVIAS